jgi:hypothetical protein
MTLNSNAFAGRVHGYSARQEITIIFHYFKILVFITAVAMSVHAKSNH